MNQRPPPVGAVAVMKPPWNDWLPGAAVRTSLPLLRSRLGRKSHRLDGIVDGGADAVRGDVQPVVPPKNFTLAACAPEVPKPGQALSSIVSASKVLFMPAEQNANPLTERVLLIFILYEP